MEIVIRVCVVYVFVFFGLRVLGKRELNQLSAIELMALMLIPEIVSQALSGETSMTNAIVGVSTLFALVFLTSLFSYLYKPVRNILEGRSLILKDEKGLELESMDKERISVDELMSELRHKGFEDLKQIKTIVLEADGKISLIPYHRQESEQLVGQQEKKSI